MGKIKNTKQRKQKIKMLNILLKVIVLNKKIKGRKNMVYQIIIQDFKDIMQKKWNINKLKKLKMLQMNERKN